MLDTEQCMKCYYADEDGVCDKCCVDNAAFEPKRPNERICEWISVKDRLPNPYESVLTYMPGERPLPTVHEGFVNKHGNWHAGYFDRLPDEVVAWREMPEPPSHETWLKGE